jgi:hypothetical protein
MEERRSSPGVEQAGGVACADRLGVTQVGANDNDIGFPIGD